jgi:hypothetical protein
MFVPRENALPLIRSLRIPVQKPVSEKPTFRERVNLGKLSCEAKAASPIC